MEKRSPKKALKKRRSKIISEAMVSDSDESDNETPDVPGYNGVDTTLHENDDSLLSDGGWSSDDDRELVQKVKSTSKQTDKVSYKTRLKQLNWNDIAFKSYTAKDCEKRFQYHLKHVRRFRNLNEIVVDMEINIKKCPIKKPLNSYQLFIQDQLTNVKSSGAFSETMKNLATLYKELPSEERAAYEQRAEQLRLEYKQKRAEFDAGNNSGLGKTATSASSKAKTPFMLYAESKKLEESDYSKLRENYNNLPIDEKYKWVIKAVSEAKDRSPENIAKLLNKEEQRIYKGQLKTTPSAYSLFVKELYSQIKDECHESKNVFTEVALRWKKLDAKKKKIYMDAAAILKEKAAQEQEAFNERHGVTPQRTNKRRKSTFVEHPPEDGSDQEKEEAEKVPSPKKRKISASDTLESGSDDTNARHIQIKLPVKQKSSSKVKTPTKPESPAKQESPAKLSSPKPNAVVESPEKNIVEQLNVNDKEDKEETQEKKKKKKKKKVDSESSEYNEHKSESDAVHSSSSASSKKKSKKEKIEPPTDKPPSDLFTYFAQFIHKGKPHKAQKAFDKLPKKERKQLQAEYNEKIQTYMARLRRYLDTLTREEATDYINKIKEAENAGEKAGEDSSQEY